MKIEPGPTAEDRPHREVRRRGEGVRLRQPVRVRDRRPQQDRHLRRDPERREDREELQDLQPHLHLRRGDDRGRRLHRPQRHLHQRHVPPVHGRGRRASDGGGLGLHPDAHQEGGLGRLQHDDPGRRDGGGEGDRGRGQRGDEGRPPGDDRGREPGEGLEKNHRGEESDESSLP